ncbi:redox-regulated ATPase YchF [Mycoplasma phocimorsus]|uniref:redox-regulated ATPase YchF n=1 Tax=Mycoplasma phocimorsus TaxID=3045839 RepID=UPI0024BFF350|nr:redox-regulated ATPase YchF [Mycoplasma phocimorsus]MDJ1646122.1 redox-regulated ATPase YchF [Mycoplasma phocimorsus]
MALKAGIVGLPNVGKSCLFTALTKKMVESRNYAFTTIEPNISTVKLEDERIQKLAEIVKPDKIQYATFDFVDIAGLVKGASKGEGLGNKFLGNIREVNAIVHVVRCFENKDIMHVNNKIDPVFDVQVINEELILADLNSIESMIAKINKKAKSGDKEAVLELNLFYKIQKILENGQLIYNHPDVINEENILKKYQFLTSKPMIYVANIDSDSINDFENNKYYKQLKIFLKEAPLLPISILAENEISQVDDESREEFLEMYNLQDTSLNKLAKMTFDILGLKTYFTAGKIEVRAWVYKDGMNAPECAGIIHTDFQNKFIKAEVISYQDFIENNGEIGAKNAGKMRLEGKTYIMQDGDICHFRFGK